MPLLGIYLDQTLIQEDTCTPMFIEVQFTIAKTWKQTKCPSTGQWIKKIWYTYRMEWQCTPVFFLENPIDRGACQATVHGDTESDTTEQLTLSLVDQWIKKIWYIYTMESYSAIKKKEIMPFAATWMDLNIIIVGKVRQRQILYDVISMWNLEEGETGLPRW